MRIKLDENLPASLAETLSTFGHETDTVPEEGLAGKLDHEVWAAAQKNRRVLITQDLDFADARRFDPGTHHGLILLRLRLPGRQALARRLEEIFNRENVEDWGGCFIVVSDLKVRVRSRKV